ncbi:hypothetical protein [Paenibacillus sp. NPDC057967]|uniref:hypothetical protein n=1 Tax=Paenibacillus sp. NPDC057967 TaxID=3346293 RepID=UPI0036DBCC9C
MDLNMQDVISYLKEKGIDVAPQKSTFQLNTEMVAVLLTFLMAEVDFLRARVDTLEGGGENA